jgi:hypothetical protein
LKISWLLYGYAGSGKTDLATSVLWDREKKDFRRKGYWITFGRESNASVRMPVVTVKEALEGKFGNLRFTTPTLDDLGWQTQFMGFAKAVYAANKKAQKEGKPVPVEAIVIDGLSEFDVLYEQAFRTVNEAEVRRNTYALWNDLMVKFVSVIQLLDPVELDAHVIVTARVSERKKGVKNKDTGEVSGADPDFVPGQNVPSVNGQFRDNFPHYFNLVSYVETKVQTVKMDGKQVSLPVHRVHLLQTSDEYLLKNQWEREWIKAGRPATMSNTSFDEVFGVIEEISK